MAVVGHGPTLTRAEIAGRTGRSPDASLGKDLARMREDGILTGKKGEEGYGVATPYLPPVE